MSFSPDPASVKVGQSVIWHNADVIAHTATGSDFDTGPIGPGQDSAPIIFSSAGSRPYHCTIHPSMTGTLDVTQ
jgi:plastocyanin